MSNLHECNTRLIWSNIQEICQKIIDFLLQPLILPVWSALVAVALTFLAQWLWERHKHARARKHTFLILRRELELHKKILSDMNNDFGGGNIIHSKIDPYAIRIFLMSNYIDVYKDSTLISQLHEHLQNIGSLIRVLRRIDMAAVSIIDQTGYIKGLEENVKRVLAEIHDCLDVCLNEIDKIFPPKSPTAQNNRKPPSADGQKP